MGGVWTWGRRGWGDVGGDELGQTQRRKYGSKKTDDVYPRRLRSSGCRSLTFCARRDLRQDLICRRRLLPLLEEGRIDGAQSLPSIAGTEIAIENENGTPTKT